MKICNRCLNEKQQSDFYRDKTNPDGHAKRCIECSKEAYRLWKSKDPERARKQWRGNYGKHDWRGSRWKRKYGISKDEYELLMNLQGGVCAICSMKKDLFLSVDHSHSTGEVRGLLCSDCNLGLGHFFDNIAFLEKAIKYLAQS